MALEIIQVSIEGISPLLLNNPASMRGNDGTLGKKTIPSPEEESESATYRIEGGQLAVPAAAFPSCVYSAAKYRRIGKQAATSVVKGSVFIRDEFVGLCDKDGAPLTEYEIDVRRAVIQRAGILRCRPKVQEWTADVKFEVDTEFLPVEHLVELMDIAGRTVGVGDYRPERRGPFGRFQVTI